ncbi:MAG: hypothetical protein A4E32_00775 [Methanomassiliicoccales archaeon PtaU1.Bin124]|nr:MAG: hypothetical protein A4E32_00775 [Methanomassiliicoccales archaeon PtaU1.Bin124]
MSFDPIPDEIWDDWKWFVCPEGCLLGLRDDRYRVDGSEVHLTPNYVINLPKLIMSDVMWASRLDNTAEGVVDTKDYFRSVRVSVDSIIDGIIFLISQHPMVVLQRPTEAQCERRLTDALSEDELILVSSGTQARENLDTADLDVQFFNPFAEGARPIVDMLGLIPAEMCIKELSLAKANQPDSVVREVISNAIEELRSRQMVNVEDGVVVSMTLKGKAVLDVEPVHDMLSCSCQVDPCQ